jgi:hypothetical protein
MIMARFDILNLAGPPRPVPFLVRLRVLFGGFTSQFGWLFLGFGLIFVWVFTVNMNLKGWLALRGELENTQGVITKIERRTTSSGKHRSSRTYYQHYYSFEGPDGVEYTGFSNQDFSRKVGEKATILYPKNMPDVSRISGMRASVIGPMGLMPVIFPVIGLCFVIAGFRKGIKANHLLANGELEEGRLKSKDKTNTQINKQPVYKLTFEFSTPEGTNYEVFAKTHLPEKLEDQQEEPLLYDPMYPKNAVMLDNLPGAPRIDEHGNICAGSPIVVLLNLVIPGISVIGHGVYIYIRFLA